MRWTTAGERCCLAILLGWLVWIPLPFGSNVEGARPALITIPLLLCASAALLRMAGSRGRIERPRAWRIWTGGAVLLIAVAVLQLVPLPPSLLNVISPDSAAIWNRATRLAAIAGVPATSAHPISIDPSATALELMRLVALFAVFQTSAMLVRSHPRRFLLAIVLCATAIFEVLYGAHEAALGRYAIWGWTNTLIFNRVTGTFVNPNHFAHYAAIILPLALFLAALAWHHVTAPDTPFGRRFVRMVERHFLLFSFGKIAAVACVAAILVAQSRGGLLSMSAGVMIAGAFASGRRPVRLLLAGGALAVVILSLILFLGTKRTVARFIPNDFEQKTLVGRRIGIDAATRLWQRFPVAGTGLGTFERVVSMEQTLDVEKMYHHAHNDYAELAATGGTLGFLVVIVSLIGGYAALVRTTFTNAAS
ncbi:MAG TPA: O-antigen ligase family protein, partial [Thermoanaerobaculia bacterium]|nr:O-antigen ligase family protein [Thermoanaerobaculia bacterium]